jgi:hypothetical protein
MAGAQVASYRNSADFFLSTKLVDNSVDGRGPRERGQAQKRENVTLIKI